MTQTEAGIARVSRKLEWLVWAGLIGLAALLICMAVLPAWLSELARAAVPGPAPDALSIGQHVALILVVAVALAPAAYVLWSLARLFRLFGLGEVFSEQPARLLRRIGWGSIIGAVLGVVAHSLAIIVITASNQPGERQLVISLDANVYMAVLFGALLIVLGWVQGEAARLAAENRGII